MAETTDRLSEQQQPRCPQCGGQLWEWWKRGGDCSPLEAQQGETIRQQAARIAELEAELFAAREAVRVLRNYIDGAMKYAGNRWNRVRRAHAPIVARVVDDE